MSQPTPPAITLMKYPGLAGGSQGVGPEDAMPTFVTHNTIGLNYMTSGRMQVLRATGYRYVLGPGRLAVFWGAVPHKVESYAPDSWVHWLALPLGTFLRWDMPANFTHQLIQGRVFFETDKEEGRLDLALMNRWHQAIGAGSAEWRSVVLLELEARLRRLALSSPAQRKPRITPRGPSSQAERMLLLISERFRERLTAGDIATAVGLHPGYASGLFKRHVGMGITEYLTECRLSHAKALLATTDAKVLHVARESGFRSISQFHDVFKRLAGSTPRAFRMNLRKS